MLKSFLFKRKLNKRALSDGSIQKVAYYCTLNNDESLEFESEEGMITYVLNYRSKNEIFNLSMNRVVFYEI